MSFVFLCAGRDGVGSAVIKNEKITARFFACFPPLADRLTRRHTGSAAENRPRENPEKTQGGRTVRRAVLPLCRLRAGQKARRFRPAFGMTCENGWERRSHMISFKKACFAVLTAAVIGGTLCGCRRGGRRNRESPGLVGAVVDVFVDDDGGDDPPLGVVVRRYPAGYEFLERVVCGGGSAGRYGVWRGFGTRRHDALTTGKKDCGRFFRGRSLFIHRIIRPTAGA